MQIVINIDEEKYEYIKGLYKACTDYQTTLMLYDAVRHGTVLPKGHGRFIDADELIKDRVENDNIVILVNTAPTVLEADRED